MLRVFRVTFFKGDPELTVTERGNYRFSSLAPGLQVSVKQTQNRLNQIKCVIKTSLGPSLRNNQWDALFGAAGRQPESRTCEQNSHKQTALPKVTRSLFGTERVQTQNARGGRWKSRSGRRGVIEEVKQRSMFDTALILLLSVKRFQHRNNTGP